MVQGGKAWKSKPGVYLDPAPSPGGKKCHTPYHPPHYSYNADGVISPLRVLPGRSIERGPDSSLTTPLLLLYTTMRQAIRSIRQSTPARGLRFNSSSSSSAPNPAQNPQVQKAVENAQKVLAQTSATVRRVAGPVGDKVGSALGG